MKKLVFVILVIILIMTSWFYLQRTYPLTPPLKSTQYFVEYLFKPRIKLDKETIGFLPYWRIEDAKYTRLDLLTEVNYFGLFINGEGEFVKVVNGETNPGWREWESEKLKDFITKSKINGTKFTLTIVSQNNDDIESILNSKNNQKRLINNIVKEVKNRNLDGINIDFEYLNTETNCHPELVSGSTEKIPDQVRNDKNTQDDKCKIDELKPKFTDFSEALNAALKNQNPHAKLELSIMPRSARPPSLRSGVSGQARSPDIFEFTKLVPLYDNFIGMSYDFYGSYPDAANPIAPMTGFKENKYIFDVTTMYEDLKKFIPKEKIIMGVPHYGWDWTVEDGKTIQSETIPQSDPDGYAAVISYARAKEFKEFRKNQCFFDEYALEPWCWYTDPKTKVDHQVWYQNEKSIDIKYDFANKHEFAGIAIWTLGYDKNYPELWNLMKEKFSRK